MTYDLYLAGKLLAQSITLDAAENVTNLDPAEIEWAIEEYGVCTTLDASGEREVDVVAHGDKPPQMGG